MYYYNQYGNYELVVYGEMSGIVVSLLLSPFGHCLYCQYTSYSLTDYYLKVFERPVYCDCKNFYRIRVRRNGHRIYNWVGGDGGSSSSSGDVRQHVIIFFIFLVFAKCKHFTWKEKNLNKNMQRCYLYSSGQNVGKNLTFM